MHNHIAYDLSESLLRVSRRSFSSSQTVPSHSQIPHRRQMPLRNHSPSPRDCNLTLPQLFHPAPPMAGGKSSCLLPFLPSGSVRDCMGSEEGLGTGPGESSASDVCAQQVCLDHQPHRSQVRWCVSLSPALGREQWEDPRASWPADLAKPVSPRVSEQPCHSLDVIDPHREWQY